MQKQEPNLYLTTAHYYDSDNEALGTADIEFYSDLAQKIGGPVLDLCCGTGRVALPLAISGLEVTAVDLSEPMLSILHKKAGNIKVEIVQGDMRTLELNRKFKLIIIALRSFQVLKDDNDIDQTFATLHRHLAPDGILVINLFKPLKDMKSIEGVSEEREVTNSYGNVLYTRYGINYFIDTQNQMVYSDFEYRTATKDLDAPVVREQLKIRYYSENQFYKMLHEHQFKVNACYGDYDQRSTNDERSTELIFICQPALS